MTIRECYDAMGGNYADVEGRLRTEERIKKFVLRVLNDSSYELLCKSIEDRSICQNLSLDRLYESSNNLAELLRNKEDYSADLEPVLEKVKEDYQVTIDCIKQLD